MPMPVLLLLLLLLVGWWCWRRRDLLVASWKLPGPVALPLVGCAYLFICGQEEIFGRARKLLATYDGPLCRMWIGTKLLIVVQSPKFIEEVMKNPDLQEKGDIMQPTKVIFGEGLITGSGPKWRSHRKAIVPNFAPRVVEKYMAIFQQHGEILLELLRPSAEREERISIDKYLHACCFDIVSETLIDHKSKTQWGENVQLADDTVAVYQSVFQSMVQPWRQSVQRAAGQCFDDYYAARIRDYFQTAIDRKRAEMRSSPERDGGAEGAAAERGWSTLERLERARFSSSDEELCYEFNNLFIASFDTVAIIVSFALRMLAMYPEHQKRAAEEALGAEGAAGRCGAGELAFLERCVLETIRLFPIAPFLTRACRKTWYLSDGTMIPGGSTILISAFSAHRLPAEWDEPLRFEPDRFLPGAHRHPFAYIPFSYGMRGCVGKTFAIMCCKSLLCQILQQFEFGCDPAETVAGMKLSCDISVREIGGSHVNIRRREVKA